MTPSEWIQLARDGGFAFLSVCLGYVVVHQNRRIEALHAGRLADEKEKGAFVLGLLERVISLVRDHSGVGR